MHARGQDASTNASLRALLLSDGKPGHQRQAEGILAAIARLRPVTTASLVVRRRWVVPSRTLARCVNLGMPASLILRIGYGIPGASLPPADLVVSAGGETLAANVAVAKLLRAPNVFSGRLRRMRPDRVSVILVSLDRLATHHNCLVCLPPSPVVPHRPAGVAAMRKLGRDSPPRRVGVLIGGNSGTYRYRAEDWRRLTDFLRDAHQASAIRWLATTSRRSGAPIAEAIGELARDPSSGVETFIDYRTAGPGTLGQIYAAADAILCTDDSTSMISEAIAACLPVVSVRPALGRLPPQEREYRELLVTRGWYRALALADLTTAAFLAALGEITPPASSPLDALASGIASRLPRLFPSPGR
jgi:mitochondrial fission protein ELM1